MPADTRVKVGTQWRTIGANGIYAHAAGSYKDVEYGYAKVNGTWQTTYIKDETPPALPTNLKVAWEYPGLRITWTNPSDADLASMELVIYPDGEPYLSAISVAATPGSNGSYYYHSSYIRNYQKYRVNFRPVDTNGNRSNGTWATSMEFTGEARGRTPSPISFRPTDSGSWDESANIWRTNQPGNPQRVFQGASSSRNNRGAMFYGNQFHTYLRGATITAARLDLTRMNTTGAVAAISPEMTWSEDITSKAVNPETGTRHDAIPGTAMARGWSQSTVLPASWRTAMGQNLLGNSLRSIIFLSADVTLQPGLGDVSGSYMGMYGAGDPGPYSGSYPGLIYVEHSG